MTRKDHSRGAPAYVPRTRPREDDQTATNRRLALADRKERFEALNKLAIKSGTSWMVSIPGDFEVRVEALPTSTFPAELRAAGYQLRPEGDGQRILAHAIVERFGRNADGSLSPLTAESTMPVVHQATHAGIVGVLVYSFLL